MKELLIGSLLLLSTTSFATDKVDKKEYSTNKMTLSTPTAYPLSATVIKSSIKKLGKEEAKSTCAKKLDVYEEDVILKDVKLEAVCAYCVEYDHFIVNKRFSGISCADSYLKAQKIYDGVNNVIRACEGRLKFKCARK